jgi:hypothetical protein
MPRHASSPASTALGDVFNGRHHVVAVFVIRALDLRHEAADKLGSKPLRGIRYRSRIRCVRNEPAQGLGERCHPALSYRRASIAIDGGASRLMNTGCSVCDLNCHLSCSSNMHSLIRSAINIGGFDWGAGGRTVAIQLGGRQRAKQIWHWVVRAVSCDSSRMNAAFHSHLVQASAPPFGLDEIVGGSGTAHPEQLGVLTLNLVLIGLLLESFSLLRLMRHEYR